MPIKYFNEFSRRWRDRRMKKTKNVRKDKTEMPRSSRNGATAMKLPTIKNAARMKLLHEQNRDPKLRRADIDKGPWVERGESVSEVSPAIQRIGGARMKGGRG